MMVVKYATDGGKVLAVIQSTVPDLLQAQVRDDEPGMGYLMAETEASLAELVERWHIEAEQLMPKTVVRLTATPNPFVADGTSACWITVAPFHPCTVSLGGEPFVLTEEDPQLLLTSAQPHTWEVQLEPETQLWASPIVVEAQHAT